MCTGHTVRKCYRAVELSVGRPSGVSIQPPHAACSWMCPSSCVSTDQAHRELSSGDTAVTSTQLLVSIQSVQKPLLFTEACEQTIKPRGFRNVQLFHNNLYLTVTFEQFNISFCISFKTFCFPHRIFFSCDDFFLSHSHRLHCTLASIGT